ncbi:GFA family protein [Trinickia acidisoli]|uniref:GFA family protein n=1 Tax=Trinickia acidisoli TaxID=2767482 RepID=UPI001A8C2E92|nr:GFA family protein [Trinickia acidisoli]
MTTQQYTGGCHCGDVRFDVELDLAQTIVCNCSICTKRGFIWAFASREQFAWRSGEDATGEYLFNKHAISHRFCRRCGVEPFAFGVAPNGAQTAAINVRCLDGVDLAGLNPTPIDGASR